MRQDVGNERENDDLPEVEHSFPLVLRLLLIGFGLAAVVLPIRELGRALWPPTLIGAFFGVIVVGAAWVGLGFIVAGVYGETQHWRYLPRTLVVVRGRWHAQSPLRLTSQDIVTLRVRHIEDSEGPDSWRVIVVPRIPVDVPWPVSLWQGGESGFESGDFTTRERAESALRALSQHLGRPDASA